MKTKILLICICMSLLLTACSNSKGVSGTPKDDVKKYNSYIEILNFNSGWLRLVAHSYFEKFGTDEEMTIKKGSEGFTLFSSMPTKGENSLYEFHKERHTKLPRKYLASNPSYGEIDAKMATLCDKMDVFIELYFKEVNIYYTDKEYEKDNFAKGRELHRRMVSSYKELVAAETDFSVAFYPKMVEYEGADLPKFKSNGFSIHYYALSVLLSGKEIVHMFDQLENEGKDFLEADLAKYEELNNKFNSDVAELQKIYKDKAQLNKEGYSEMQLGFLSQFVNTAGQMQTEATDALNMIKAGTTKIKKSKPGTLTTLGPAYPVGNLRRQLDSLIGEYNNSISKT